MTKASKHKSLLVKEFRLLPAQNQKYSQVYLTGKASIASFRFNNPSLARGYY
ncbi:hypothetical protein [Dyadobacter bucti]|uniref:hypothetical protein n=1 Tax=Dyadobacter bucti TaxID=2572203 RepID=UPI0014087791|nr:hypothetical protein [Dyadobacter bucti]